MFGSMLGCGIIKGCLCRWILFGGGWARFMRCVVLITVHL
jgi:hypothetical protein